MAENPGASREELSPAGFPKELLARYRIEAELGRGSMGIVYQAYDVRLDRYVAIKELYSAPGRGDTAAQAQTRFLREAQLAARLNHPNIVTIHDIQTVERRMFMVMELLKGAGLRQILAEEGPRPVTQALSWMIQATRALENAHRNHIIHRDVKPENMIITRDGQLKIMDFGIAQQASHGKSSDRGGTMGTPAYFAPELLQDAIPGPQTDIFALGVVFYELLAGTNPFGGGSVTQILTRIVSHEPAPLSRERADVPPGLADVIARMMARNPEDRYQSAGELLAALEHPGVLAFDRPVDRDDFAEESATLNDVHGVLPPDPGRRRPLLLGMTAALVLVGGVALGLSLVGSRPSPAGRPQAAAASAVVAPPPVVASTVAPGMSTSEASAAGPALSSPSAASSTSAGIQPSAGAAVGSSPPLESSPSGTAPAAGDPERSTRASTRPENAARTGDDATLKPGQAAQKCRELSSSTRQLDCLEKALKPMSSGVFPPEPVQDHILNLLEDRVQRPKATLLAFDRVPKPRLERKFLAWERGAEPDNFDDGVAGLVKLGRGTTTKLYEKALSSPECAIRKRAAEHFIKEPTPQVKSALERAFSNSYTEKEQKKSGIKGLLKGKSVERIQNCDYVALELALKALENPKK